MMTSIPAADLAVPALLNAVLSGEDLTAAEASWVMGEIIADAVHPVQLAGLLVALRAKGETVQEITDLVDTILADVVPVPVDNDVVDVAGTGGDRALTVNISTMSALVVAGTGIRVVKSGNRSVSSQCGSSDVLEALGIPLNLSAQEVARCVTEAGIGYLHAPNFFPGFKNVVPVRRALGVPSVFNFIGPLINPVRPCAKFVGCASEAMAPKLAAVLAGQGSSAIVARGEDGLDEISTTAPTRVWLVSGGRVQASKLEPSIWAFLGLDRRTFAAVTPSTTRRSFGVYSRVRVGPSAILCWSTPRPRSWPTVGSAATYSGLWPAHCARQRTRWIPVPPKTCCSDG